MSSAMKQDRLPDSARTAFPEENVTKVSGVSAGCRGQRTARKWRRYWVGTHGAAPPTMSQVCDHAYNTEVSGASDGLPAACHRSWCLLPLLMSAHDAPATQARRENAPSRARSRPCRASMPPLYATTGMALAAGWAPGDPSEWCATTPHTSQPFRTLRQVHS